MIVATHDAEFAAAFAERAVLLADGRVIADGPDRRGARRRLVLRHRDRPHPRRRRRRAAARAGRRSCCAAGRASEVRRELAVASFAAPRPRAGRRLRLVRARAARRARVVALVGDARRARRARPDRVRAAAQRQADHRHRAVTGYALAARRGSRSGAVAVLASNVFFGQGPWTPWQMARLGAIGGPARRSPGRSPGGGPGLASLAVAGAAQPGAFGAGRW